VSRCRWLIHTLFIGLMAGALTACGKVTQVAQPNTDTSFFDGTGRVMVSTSNRSLTTLSLGEAPFYVVVRGIHANGKSDELAWGKVTITRPPRTAQWEQAKAVAYRKGDVIIDKASPSWAYLRFNPSGPSVELDVRRLKKGYAHYWVVLYTGTGRAVMTLIDGEKSALATVNITPWDAGSTHRSLIRLAALANPSTRATPPSWDTLSQVITDASLATLGWDLPTPAVASVMPEAPSLAYGRERDTQLLSVMTLLDAGNTAGALQLLKRLETNQAIPGMTPADYAVIADRIELR